MSPDTFTLIANIFAILGWIGAAGFMVTYAIRAPWHRSFTGRTLMYFVSVIFVVLSLNISTLWFPDYDGRQIVRVAIYALIVFMVWRLWATLWLALSGKISQSTPNYSIIKHIIAWFKRRGKK